MWLLAADESVIVASHDVLRIEPVRVGKRKWIIVAKMRDPTRPPVQLTGALGGLAVLRELAALQEIAG